MPRWAACILLVLTSCATPPDEGNGGPPGSDGPKIFFGDTRNQNDFAEDVLAPPGFCTTSLDPLSGTRDVLLLFVEAENDPADLWPSGDLVYALEKQSEWNADLGDYWERASYGATSVHLDPVGTVQTLEGSFTDYFYGDFVTPTLTTRGLAGATWPLQLSGQTASISIAVRSDTDASTEALEQKNVLLAVSTSVPSAIELAADWQATFDEVRPDWVKCKVVGDEIEMSIEKKYVADGAFLHTRDNGQNQHLLGLDGPFERHGANARLVGKKIPSPVTTGGGTFQLEIRSRDRTRRYDVTVAPGTYSPLALSKSIAADLNDEFAWIEAPDQVANDVRLRLWMTEAFGAGDSTVRVTGGDAAVREELGLDGPKRVDGVTDENGRLTARDAHGTIEAALSLYMTAKVEEEGPPLDPEDPSAIEDYVLDELGHYTAFMVVFVDTDEASGRRAAAFSRWPIDVTVSQGGFKAMKQLEAGGMFGVGDEPWETWAHEFGHVLGFFDLYRNSLHDPSYATADYVNDWGLMDNHLSGSHVVLGHKGMPGWVGDFAEVPLPQIGVDGFESTFVNLAPLEFDLAEYAGIEGAPFHHGACLQLDEAHAILVEYRRPGDPYSQNLPGGGGVLVTDVVDPHTNTDTRPPITVLNPNGIGNGVGLEVGDLHDLGGANVFPAYPGNLVRVVKEFPGKPGFPGGVRVEISRGPSEYVDPKITPWRAPDAYVTPDIWIDWPGDGESWGPDDTPPVGNGDRAHWHPDGSVVNHVMVRVTNGGTVLAEDVLVEAFAVDVGIGDAGWIPLLEDAAPARDIPAGESRDFRFVWRPTAKGHSCIKARIRSHGSEAPESTTANNEAKENVTSFFPTKGSPYAPTPVRFELRNVFDGRTRLVLRPTGLRPGFDLELSETRVSLGPKEHREITGWLYVDESLPPQVKQSLLLNIHAERFTGDSWVPYGGFSANVIPTTASELELSPANWVIRPDGETRFVVVRGTLKGAKRAGQPVDVALVDSAGGSHGGSALTGADGTFEVVIDGVAPGPAEVLAYYFGPFMAPSEAGPVPYQVQ